MNDVQPDRQKVDPEVTDHTLGYALVERVADRLETEFGDDLPADVRAALNVLRDATLPPAPSEPGERIPEGRVNAELLVVDWENRGVKASVTGLLFRENGHVYNLHNPAPDSIGEAPASYAVAVELVTHVELLHTHNPETHVPVERALIERAFHGIDWRQQGAPLLGADLRDVLASEESSASDGGRS